MWSSPTAKADRRIAVYLFLLAAAIYGYFWGGGGWNQNATFDLTRAIVEERTVAIDSYVTNTGDYVFRGGHYYANKAPGLGLLAAIPYSVLYRVDQMVGVDPSAPLAVSANAYICSLFACVIPGALIPALLYLFGRRHDFPARWALTVSLIVAFGTSLFPWATILITHGPSGAFAFLAFCELTGGRKHRALVGGAAAGMSGLMNYLCIPIALILLAWSFFSKRALKHSILFGVGALPFAALFFWYQKAAFGSFFRNPATMNEAFMTKGAWLGLINPPSLDALIGITISPYRGLFYYAPVLLFTFAGAVVLYRQQRSYFWVIVPAIMFFFLFNVTFNNWEGGFGTSARYVVPAIPLMGVLLLYTRKLFRPLFAVLCFISLVNNFSIAAVDPQPSASIQAPLTDYIYPLLLTGRFSPDVPIHPRWSPQYITGHVGVVRQTLLEPVPFMLFPPGSFETEWASFNLGESVTRRGELQSLIPIVLILMVGASALFMLAGRIDREEA